MRTPVLLPTLLLAGASVATGQSVRTIDRGSFTITVNGQRAGREEFTIAGTPGANGVEYLSRATVVYGDKRLFPSLWSDSVGVPRQYTVEVKGTSGVNERWMGRISRGRVSAQIDNSRGPSEREYVVADGAVLVDDDVFHQYYFVVRRAATGNVTIVVPRRNAQIKLTGKAGVSDPVTIAGTAIAAQHLVFAEPTGAVREVWVDAQGRVLKVSIPSRNVVALRDDPPAP